MTTLSRTKHAIQMALALVVAALALAGCKQGMASSSDTGSNVSSKCSGYERLPFWCRDTGGTGGTGGGQAVTNSTGWNAEQLANAATIVAVGREMGVPRQARVVALAAAMQESSLRNLEGGDRDSVGLFQQRPSQGWGSWAECHNAQHASRSFYRALLNTHGWEGMSVTRAAQAVQISAYPNAYAKWADDAEKLAG